MPAKDEGADDDDGRGAVTDPAGYYTDPTAIQADKTLSKPQKRRYLKDLGADLAEAPAPDPALQADVKAVRAKVEAAPATPEPGERQEKAPAGR